MEIKQVILTVDDFLEKRPEFISFQETSIQSAINQAITMLDSECNGLISKVWSYNTQHLAPNDGSDNSFLRPTQDNELYRTQWELTQIMEAHISQVQYSLNMGNDFTSGSDSFSIGGVNGSFSRPLDRKPVAPSVYKLLQNGRVYNLQYFVGGDNKNGGGKSYVDPYDQEAITRAIGDKRYVNIDQPSTQNGNIAYVCNGKVSFGNPQDLNITTYNTKNILDTQTNNYVSIDKVKDLAFFGPNLYGYRSGVERGEMLSLLSLVNMNWNEHFFYKKHTLLTYAYQNNKGEWLVQDFLAKRDNIGKNPTTSPDDWEALGAIPFDINEVVNLCFERVVAKYDSQFDSFVIELNSEFNTLRTYLETRQDNFENTINENFNNFENTINENFNRKSQEIDNHFDSLENELKTTTIPNEITTQLDALPSTIITLFFKNEIRTFTTRQDFLDLNLGLIENQDYEVLNANKILYNVNGIIDVEQYNLNDSNTTQHLKPFYLSGSNRSKFTNAKLGITGWNVAEWGGNASVSTWYGYAYFAHFINLENANIDYQEVFMIRFLRNIEKKQLIRIGGDNDREIEKDNVGSVENTIPSNVE